MPSPSDSPPAVSRWMWTRFVPSKPGVRPCRFGLKNFRPVATRSPSWSASAKRVVKTLLQNSPKSPVWVANSIRPRPRTSRSCSRWMNGCEACLICPRRMCPSAAMSQETLKSAAGVPLVRTRKVVPSLRSKRLGAPNSLETTLPRLRQRAISPKITWIWAPDWAWILRPRPNCLVRASAFFADRWRHCIARLPSSCWIRIRVSMAMSNAGPLF